MENRVGFGLRLGAALIDFVILSIVALVGRGLVASLFPNQLAVMLQWQTADVPPGSPGVGIAEAIGTFTFAAVFLGLLYGLFEVFAGRSPGKQILSLRIVDEAGQRAPIGKLLIRYAIKQSSTILSVLSLILASKPLNITSSVAGIVWFLGCFLVLTRSRQALHDKIAGTAVLRKSDVGVPATAPATPAASL